jgi:VanZ family protein
MTGPGHFTPRYRRAILIACVVAWLVEMVATHMPAPSVPHFHVSDKAVHAVAYFLLGGLFWLTLWAYGMRRWKRRLYVLVTLAVYAALDELTQELVTGRHAAVGDWLADMVGLVAAVMLAELVATVFRSKAPA